MTQSNNIELLHDNDPIGQPITILIKYRVIAVILYAIVIHFVLYVMNCNKFNQ